MPSNLSVLMLTSEWPTPEHPEYAPFIVQQVDFLRRAGVKVQVFAFRGAKNPTNYVRAYYALRRQFQLQSYDLIHAQFGQSGILAFPNPVPLVVTFHGSDAQGIIGKSGNYTISGRLLQQFSRFVARRADQAILVSSHLNKFLPTRSYHILPLGVNMELFAPMAQAQARRILDLDAAAPLVLFAANPLSTLKRFGLAQAAVERARIKFPEARLIALGNVPHHQVPTFMNACDALLLTSIHEGSPTVVKEALACNLPVVTTAVGDVRERLGAVEGCVVCADDSPETIAEGLTQVLTKRQRIEGRAAVQDLDEKVVTRKVIEVYHLALGRTVH